MRILLAMLTTSILALAPGLASAFDLEENLRELHPQYVPAATSFTVQSGSKTLSQAVAEIRNRTGGKIVGAETKLKNGREVHHIKVLTREGKVRTFKVRGGRR